MQDQSALRRVPACTGLRAATFLATDLVTGLALVFGTALAVGFPTVFTVGLLDLPTGWVAGLIAVFAAVFRPVFRAVFGAVLADVLDDGLTADCTASFTAGLAADRGAGLADLTGAFNPGLALTADLIAVLEAGLTPGLAALT